MASVDRLDDDLRELPSMRPRRILSGFPDTLEREFYLDTLAQSMWLIRFSAVLSFILMAGFGIVNNQILPASDVDPWLRSFSIIRVTVIAPCALFCFIFSFFKPFKRVAYPVLCSSSILITLGICVRIAFSSQTDFGYLLYYAGLMLVCIVVNVGLHMRFVHAACVGALIVLMYLVTALFFNRLLSTSQGFSIFLNNVFFLLATETLCLIACFFSEYYRRNAFLLQKKIRLEEAIIRNKAIEHWKEAYRIYTEVNAEVLSGNIKPAQGAGEHAGPPAPDYFNRLKNERIASGLTDLKNTFGADTGSGEVFERIMDMILEITGAGRGCIVLKNEETAEPEFIVRRAIEKNDMKSVLAVMHDTLQAGKTTVANNVPRDPGGTGSLLCFPIDFRGSILGACYLDGGASGPAFARETVTMLVFLVTQLLISFDEARDGKSDGLIIKEAYFNAQCEMLGFTRREKECLLLALRGYSNREITEKLFISMNTLRTHLKRINNKAGVTKRKELIRLFAGLMPRG